MSESRVRIPAESLSPGVDASWRKPTLYHHPSYLYPTLATFTSTRTLRIVMRQNGGWTLLSATLYEQTMCVCQLVINRLAEITSADLTAHTPNSFPLQMQIEMHWRQCKADAVDRRS